jgi:hypothetical protein
MIGTVSGKRPAIRICLGNTQPSSRLIRISCRACSAHDFYETAVSQLHVSSRLKGGAWRTNSKIASGYMSSFAGDGRDRGYGAPAV